MHYSAQVSSVSIQFSSIVAQSSSNYEFISAIWSSTEVFIQFLFSVDSIQFNSSVDAAEFINYETNDLYAIPNNWKGKDMQIR